MKNKWNPNDTATLKECAANVKGLHIQIERFEKWMAEKGEETIEAAIKAGGWLIKAKSLVKHGKWLPWLKKNFDENTARTVQKYMALAEYAKTNHDSLFEKCTSLRQAYFVAGILKPKPNDAEQVAGEKETDEAPETQSPDAEHTTKAKERKTPIQRIKEHRRKIQSLFVGFEENEKAILELEPLATLYNGFLERKKAKEENARLQKETDKAFGLTLARRNKKNFAAALRDAEVPLAA
jgi:hypothetical protein